ncbi:unnamed protein product [Toxocara canis]|uniref:Homeobox domain-containing protein n=1 Tax=Toxocara canis TaxID=6265 RepID=A0A183UX79_TOXCA|nr:unnamed protein product [Toxocara canis]
MKTMRGTDADDSWGRSALSNLAMARQLQRGSQAALRPKGNLIWEEFERSRATDKSAASLTTHFRKQMYSKIEKADLPLDRLIYVANRLGIRLTQKQKLIGRRFKKDSGANVWEEGDVEADGLEEADIKTNDLLKACCFKSRELCCAFPWKRAGDASCCSIELRFDVNLVQSEFMVVTGYTCNGKRDVRLTDLEHSSEKTGNESYDTSSVKLSDSGGVVAKVNETRLRRLLSAEAGRSISQKNRMEVTSRHCDSSDESSGSSFTIDESDESEADPDLIKLLQILDDDGYCERGSAAEQLTRAEEHFSVNDSSTDDERGHSSSFCAAS